MDLKETFPPVLHCREEWMVVLFEKQSRGLYIKEIRKSLGFEEKRPIFFLTII